MHVGGIDTHGTDEGGTWSAHVDLLVVDEGGDPLSDAVVTAIWTGGVLGVGGGVTASDGRCRVSLRKIRGRLRTVTFTLSDVTHPEHLYDPGRDVGSGEDGTSVIVSRPPPEDLAAAPGEAEQAPADEAAG